MASEADGGAEKIKQGAQSKINHGQDVIVSIFVFLHLQKCAITPHDGLLGCDPHQVAGADHCPLYAMINILGVMRALEKKVQCDATGPRPRSTRKRHMQSTWYRGRWVAGDLVLWTQYWRLQHGYCLAGHVGRAGVA